MESPDTEQQQGLVLTVAIERRIGEAFSLTSEDPRAWADMTDDSLFDLAAELRISPALLYDLIAVWLATGFYEGKLGFTFCDQVVNRMFSAATGAAVAREWQWPDLWWDVYLAFDEGEYHHDGDKSDDPVAEHTAPMIAEIVGRLQRAWPAPQP